MTTPHHNEKGESKYEAYATIMIKEEFLSRVVVWLKAKGLWKECLKDCGAGLVKKEDTHHEG